MSRQSNCFAGLVARGLIVLVLAGIVACAPKAIVEETGPHPGLDELLLALEKDVTAFDSLRGLAKITYLNNGDRKAANHVVIADYPGRIRLETLGLFGAQMMLAATDGNLAVVLLPGEGRAFAGPAGTGFLRKVTRLPLTAKMVVSILLRRPDLLPASDLSIEYLPDGISRLKLLDGRLAQDIDFNSARQLVRVAYLADGQIVSAINYADYVDGFPRTITIDIVDREISVKLAFSDIETNVELDDALFRLVPSDAYRVEPFPDVY